MTFPRLVRPMMTKSDLPDATGPDRPLVASCRGGHHAPAAHPARGPDRPQIASLIEGEARREFDKIRLIPSENYASVAVLEASGRR